MNGNLFPSVGSWRPLPHPSPPSRTLGCVRRALAARWGCVWASWVLVATGPEGGAAFRICILAGLRPLIKLRVIREPPSGEPGPHPLAQLARGEEGLRGHQWKHLRPQTLMPPISPPAIAMLRDKEPGSFVVRDSHSFRGAYGLAMKVATPPPSVLQLNKKGGCQPQFLVLCPQDVVLTGSS